MSHRKERLTISSYDEINYLFQMAQLCAHRALSGTLVNLFPKESIIDFSSFKHASQQKQREREKNIKNIILRTVINLLSVIVFGRWLFIDLRGEIKHQEQIKHNRDLFYVVLW